MVPAALIGFAGLADGIGPTGWRGLAELFGWVAACLAVSLAVAFLLARRRRPGPAGYAAVLLAIAAAGGFTWLVNWLGLDAPMAAKRLFTTSLQVVGTIAPAALVLWVAHAVWSSVERF